MVPRLSYIRTLRSQASIPRSQDAFRTKHFYSVRSHLHLSLSFSLFIYRIVMAAYHRFLEDTSKHLRCYQIHVEPQRECYPISYRLFITNSISSLLCVHPPLNSYNMNDSSTDSPTLRKCNSLNSNPSNLRFNPLFSLRFSPLGRQGALRHYNSQRTPKFLRENRRFSRTNNG